jgi:tetratricopeptide (TPR) repeat protein
VKTQFLIGQNRIDEAIGTLEYAATISDIFTETNCQLGQIYLIKQNNLLGDKKASSSAAQIGDKGWAAMDKCLDAGGEESLVVPEIVKEGINHYIDKNDMDKVIKLYTAMIGFEPKNTQYMITLARLYAERGDIDKAIGIADQVGAVDPKLKADADEFVRQLEAKQ